MTITLPIWFVYLWAIVLIINCLSRVFINLMIKNTTTLIETKATDNLTKILEEALQKAQSKTQKCSNTSKKESHSQKSQKK